jgi:hypothetical protein
MLLLQVGWGGGDVKENGYMWWDHLYQIWKYSFVISNKHSIIYLWIFITVMNVNPVSRLDLATHVARYHIVTLNTYICTCTVHKYTPALFIYTYCTCTVFFPSFLRGHIAKKALGIIVCRGSISMYREEISTVWNGRKIPCIYGNNHFNTSCNFRILFYQCLLMTSMGSWNDFHGCMEWFPSVHGIIAMGPWNDSMGTWYYFLGSTEKFQGAIG